MAIRSFKRGPAERLFRRDDVRGINPAHIRRIREILDLLDGPRPLQDLSLPTYRLHRLHGLRAGEWAVKVSHGWRITFRMDGEDVRGVRYENYHH
ncbi:MAG: type II toxin-antitoxin system RelE/ParE family toxin [Bryobacterales bacterium]|nr:type II toxin-antitoxin system RelE/ParE family toxin [Bryobacterales bacterium]MDE0261737.1 type II toxin-antitoxin system RelE/ParE family toxin [Bryobacterales bacterium]MDE0623980.1 type II toxin-antitoxin system RelE/ParE family toxin [Bryobacterales bacterium]